MARLESMETAHPPRGPQAEMPMSIRAVSYTADTEVLPHKTAAALAAPARSGESATVRAVVGGIPHRSMGSVPVDYTVAAAVGSCLSRSFRLERASRV